MSTNQLEQVTQLANALSTAEKANLIARLAATLATELGENLARTGARSQPGKEQNGSNTEVYPLAETQSVYFTQLSSGSQAEKASDKVTWAEPPWTDAQLHAWMKPDPKTGAEIVAWLAANPDTGGWAEMDMPDIGEWVRQLRHQVRSGLEQDE